MHLLIINLLVYLLSHLLKYRFYNVTMRVRIKGNLMTNLRVTSSLWPRDIARCNYKFLDAWIMFHLIIAFRYASLCDCKVCSSRVFRLAARNTCMSAFSNQHHIRDRHVCIANNCPPVNHRLAVCLSSEQCLTWLSREREKYFISIYPGESIRNNRGASIN